MTGDKTTKDYGSDGIDIQTAKLRHARLHPDRSTRSKYIIWNGLPVWASYDLAVPNEGRFRLEFLSEPRKPAQGVDVKVEGGEIHVSGRDSVQTLRTWNDPRYETVVEYPFKAKVGLLKVWNVYERSWPDGRVTEEKWTGNAGCLVEQEEDDCWLFRCSDGPSATPNFDQLVFRITILGE